MSELGNEEGYWRTMSSGHDTINVFTNSLQLGLTPPDQYKTGTVNIPSCTGKEFLKLHPSLKVYG